MGLNLLIRVGATSQSSDTLVNTITTNLVVTTIPAIVSSEVDSVISTTVTNLNLVELPATISIEEDSNITAIAANISLVTKTATVVSETDTLISSIVDNLSLITTPAIISSGQDSVIITEVKSLNLVANACSVVVDVDTLIFTTPHTINLVESVATVSTGQDSLISTVPDVLSLSTNDALVVVEVDTHVISITKSLSLLPKTATISIGATVTATVREILVKLFQDTHTAEQVWQDPIATTLIQDIGLLDKVVHVDTEQVLNGNGSIKYPFNNLADTLDFAELNGYKLIHVLSDITIDRNLKNFVITGIGTPAVDCNGHNLDKSEFSHCVMKGSYTGNIIAQESVLFNNFTLGGFFENCVIAGDLFCLNGSEVLLKNCSSFIAGFSQPSVSMDVSGFCNLSVRGYTGGFELRDMNNVLDKCSIEPLAGAITLASSCTSDAGELSLKGVSTLVNNSSIVNMSNKLLNPSSIWNHTQ